MPDPFDPDGDPFAPSPAEAIRRSPVLQIDPLMGDPFGARPGPGTPATQTNPVTNAIVPWILETLRPALNLDVRRYYDAWQRNAQHGQEPPDPLDPQFALEAPGVGTVPAQVPPTASAIAEHTLEIPQRAFEASENRRLGGSYDPAPILEGAGLLGVSTPFAEAGALGVAGGRAAARALSGETELAERYPKVGPPILADAKTRKPIKDAAGALIFQHEAGPQDQAMVDAGKAFWSKHLTPEAKDAQKARAKAQKDIDAGNYTPYFKISERSNVNPTRYPPYKSTAGQFKSAQPKPETIKKYTEMATNPAGVERLRKAYEHGLTLENASNWYFMHQLEQEFIKEYGERGPEMFERRVAEALAATTGGADPKSNLMTASYGNYLEAMGQRFPTEAYDVPFPVGGGKYGVMPNLKEYEKMLMPGGTGVTAANPKRYNFKYNILGEANAGTIDEQMMRLFDPSKGEPEHYGPYQQVLNDLAQMYGVDPRYFQEVAWSGAKSMIAKGGKGGEYIPKPLIQEYNEAIERTSRITGVPPAEVVRRGIVRAEMPLYGTAGVIGVGAAAQSQGDVNQALGAGAE